MADDKKINNFPNPFANPIEKKSKPYGLEYAQAIWASYNRGDGYASAQKGRDIINRKYAEGLQSVDKYKDRYDVQGTSFLNLDWNPPPLIAVKVDNLLGRMMNQEYKIECNPIDVVSKTQEDKDRDKMYADMFLKPLSDEMEKISGIPMVAKDANIPQTDEEAELWMKLNYKQASAIAMEQGIEYVFYSNRFDEVKRQLLRDAIVLKKMACYRYYDRNYDIKVEYVDPVDLIVPYSKYDDFRNIPYQAIIKKYTIQQIAQQTREFTEEQLFEIAKTQAGKNGNTTWQWNDYSSYEGYYAANPPYAGRPYDNFNISVMEFFFLTTNYERYVEKENTEKGTKTFDRKSTNYKAPTESKYKIDVIDKEIQYRYEGKWIVGCEYMYGYKMSENIDRKKIKGGYSPSTTLPISIVFPNIYDMQNKSLVERMIPHADQMTLLRLKIQQLFMASIPPGIFIDLDSIDNVFKGTGDTKQQQLDLVKMFRQVGSLAGRSTREDGSEINRPPITILPNGIPPGLDVLVAAYNNEMQAINDVIGFNSAVDSATPPVEALVGVQKMAAQASSNVMRPLNQAFITLVEKTADRVSLMIQDSVEFGWGIEGFFRAIGEQAVKTIKIGGDSKLSSYEFGIEVRMLPDEEEKADLMQYITIGLGSQPPTLKVSDAIIIKQIMKFNTKLAAQMLILRENKNREDEAQFATMNSQNNADAQAQAAQSAAESEAQKDGAISSNKAQLMQMEYDLKAKAEAEKFERDKQLLSLKLAGEKELAEMNHTSELLIAAHANAITSVATPA